MQQQQGTSPTGAASATGSSSSGDGQSGNRFGGLKLPWQQGQSENGSAAEAKVPLSIVLHGEYLCTMQCAHHAQAAFRRCLCACLSL